jgi:hypothetical protein
MDTNETPTRFSPTPLSPVEDLSACHSNAQLVASSQAARYESMHVYEICPRKDKRGVDLISDALLSFLRGLSRSFHWHNTQLTSHQRLSAEAAV